MDIWLIIEGEKSGPFQDYTIRERIRRGELNGQVHAWHNGQTGWKPLDQIELFSSEFRNPAASMPPPLPPTMAEVILSPAPSGSVWRRFWARWFDLYLYAAVMWTILSASGRDLADMIMNVWFSLFMYVPWFLIESFFIYQFGTTPGKWLLGLSVKNNDGSAIPFAKSAYRAARVFFTGIGMGWQLLAVFCQVLSWFTTRKIGKTMWDFIGGHQVIYAELKPLRKVIFVLCFCGCLMVQGAILAPYTERVLTENAPEFKEFLEKHRFPISPPK